MPVRAVLAVDQGTTNSKAVLVAETGAILATGAAPVDIRHPRPGWVEQDAEGCRDDGCGHVLARAAVSCPDVTCALRDEVELARGAGVPVGGE